MNKNAGFTLIELLVVVLIIGILSAVALPQYQKTVLKSRAAEAWSVLATTRTAAMAYCLENPSYRGDISNIKNSLSVEIPTMKKFSQPFGAVDCTESTPMLDIHVLYQGEKEFSLALNKYGQRTCGTISSQGCKDLGFTDSASGDYCASGSYSTCYYMN